MRFQFYIYTIISLILLSCQKENIHPIDNTHTQGPIPFNIEIPPGFPDKLYLNEDNPLTVEGIMLGRLLFYDGRLAGRTNLDSLMSCATCHKQEKSFECGFHPKGITGIATPHVMLPLINLIWNPKNYLWNGKIANIEDLTWMGIHAPHEMASDTNKAKATLQSIEMYPPLFKKAFGSEIITAKNMGKAIAQFIYTLISSNSKFDKFMRGEGNLTTQELKGYILFSTEEGGDCFHCHGGDGNPLFTTNLFYNNGTSNIFNDPRDRYSITKNPIDIGAYKATTLRNIELTGPYMHDGRFKTLEEVINFYSEGVILTPSISSLMHKAADGGAHLSATEKKDLIAFLKTLTDSTFINNPNFSNPRPNDPYFTNY